MKLTFNPFKLRKHVKYYANFCAKQCIALNHANAHIAELIAENLTLKKQLKVAETDVKIAQDKLKVAEMAKDLVTAKVAS